MQIKQWQLAEKKIEEFGASKRVTAREWKSLGCRKKKLLFLQKQLILNAYFSTILFMNNKNNTLFKGYH